MTTPFDKAFVPKVDAAEITKSAKRSRIATRTVERLGLSADPNDPRTARERAAAVAKPVRKVLP